VKLLFDNNLSQKLPLLITELFSGSCHVFDLNIHLESDRWIYEYAKNHQFTIVSKDKDFYHLLNTLGPPPKLIWISIGNCTNQQIIKVMRRKSNEIKLFLTGTRSLLVIE
jgi:predicted nuclease of predicted toxin-antitoxin system